MPLLYFHDRRFWPIALIASMFIKEYGPYCCMTFATLFAWSSDNFWFMATLPTDGLAFYLDMKPLPV